MPRPLVIAHRGLTTAARENTLDAFCAAVDLGADGVEFDVRRAGDGTLVVHHDADVDGLVIATASLAEVVEAGQSLGYEIPTLAEAVAALPARAILDVELKETGHEADALELLRGARPGGRFAFTSFRPESIAALRALDADLRLGLLVGSPAPAHGLATYLGELVDARRRARRIGATFLAPNWHFVSSGALRSIHLGGMAAWVWTVNEAAMMRRLLADPRVGAIITDDPALALAVRAEARGPH